jgi:predicted metal-dependent phosphoesterase TrpH
MKLDLHVHSKYSPCSNIPVNVLNKLIIKKGVDIALTDHNTMKGVKQVKCKIPGVEITTNEGHVIGLFMNEPVKTMLSPEETCDKIREQGGLSYVPHPFDRIRKGIKRVDFKPDIVEVFNGRVWNQKENKEAEVEADKYNLLKGIGTDTHNVREFGKSYMEIEDFDSVKEFKQNLLKAKFNTTIVPIHLKAYVNAMSILKNRVLKTFRV